MPEFFLFWNVILKMAWRGYGYSSDCIFKSWFAYLLELSCLQTSFQQICSPSGAHDSAKYKANLGLKGLLISNFLWIFVRQWHRHCCSWPLNCSWATDWLRVEQWIEIRVKANQSWPLHLGQPFEWDFFWFGTPTNRFASFQIFRLEKREG